MVNDQAKGWKHRYYDSYRPGGQSNPPTTPIFKNHPPSTSHDPERPGRMPTKMNQDGSRLNTVPSPRSSRNVDERNESEAQKRGIYGFGPSPISRLSGYELPKRKHSWEDQATDHSIKRRRGQESEHNDTKDDDDEHVIVPDDHRPPKGHRCENYMCMENHTYQNCDKPKICWGCRSPSHHWSDCPMTCSRCLQEHHTANHCQDFGLDPNGKSQPRACNPHPPTEPAAYRAREELLERAHSEYPLPQKPVEVSLPKRDRSEHRQASHNDLDPSPGLSHATSSQKSGPMGEGVPEITIDQRLRDLRKTPIPESSPIENTREPGFPEQPTILTQAPGKLDNPLPSAQPSISSRDPRRRRALALTPPSQPGDHLENSPTSNEDHPVAASDPSDHLADPILDIIFRRADARNEAWEESHRIMQKQNEEGLADNEGRQMQEYEHEMEEHFNQKTHDADMARKAAIQKQQEAHESRMAELRRHLKTR